MIKAREVRHCSFCEKDEIQVDRLIAGPTPIFICNECITLSHEIISERPIKFPAVELKSQYQFENFVTSNANNLALAAAKLVANSSEAAYSLLFIYGTVGVGKTHVLQAIGNSFKARNSEAKVEYIHSANFICEVVKTIKSKQLDQFKQRFTSPDLLLIDDVNFISGKPGTQQELYFIIKTLLNSGKRIVISCDTPPKEIGDILQPKLRSLFEGGVIFKLKKPDFDARIAITNQKFATLGCSIEDEVVCCIAQHFNSDVRELEGAINHVHAHSKLLSCPVTIGLVNKLFPHVFSKKRAPL
jgi:chromosomal replication initiator protein